MVQKHRSFHIKLRLSSNFCLKTLKHSLKIQKTSFRNSTHLRVDQHPQIAQRPENDARILLPVLVVVHAQITRTPFLPLTGDEREQFAANIQQIRFVLLAGERFHFLVLSLLRTTLLVDACHLGQVLDARLDRWRSGAVRLVGARTGDGE